MTTPTLKVQRSLTLLPATHIDVPAALAHAAVGNWRRDTAAEARARGLVGDKTVIAFARPRTPGSSGVSLVLTCDDGEIQLVNIVPEDGELELHAYNLIVEDFERHVVAPAATASGFHYRLGTDQATLSQLAGEEAAKALTRFSNTANRSTGASHPSDQQRWFEFLFACHHTGSSLSTDHLQAWLIEVDRWPEEQCIKLILDYEMSRALLSAYDRTL